MVDVMVSAREAILTFNAFAKGEEASLAPFTLVVTGPGYDEDRGYFCRVLCPFFREQPYLIFGVDEAQACALSIEFIRMRLKGNAELVDAQGVPVVLPEIIWNEPSKE